MLLLGPHSSCHLPGLLLSAVPSLHFTVRSTHHYNTSSTSRSLPFCLDSLPIFHLQPTIFRILYSYPIYRSLDTQSDRFRINRAFLSLPRAGHSFAPHVARCFSKKCSPFKILDQSLNSQACTICLFTESISSTATSPLLPQRIVEASASERPSNATATAFTSGTATTAPL